MIEIETKTKKWGNSVGIILGKKFKPNMKVKVLISDTTITKAGDIFGKLELTTSVDELMKKIDRDLGM